MFEQFAELWEEKFEDVFAEDWLRELQCEETVASVLSEAEGAAPKKTIIEVCSWRR